VTDARFAILALAPQVWDEQWVNRQQLLSRVGRKCDVLYSTGGWFLWDRHSPAWREARWGGGFRRSDNVWLDESPRYLMRWPRIPFFDRAVMLAQARRWRSWATRMGAHRLVANICHPKYFPYLDLLKPEHVVYQVYDLYDHMPGWHPEWEAHERNLLERADLVFAVSQTIVHALRAKVDRPVRVLPNGADVAAFLETAEAGRPAPPDLAQVPRPRIGWTGSLHPQIDFGLVASLATRRPDWHFVFVGNKVTYTEPLAEREYLDCARLENVHFLGYKDRREVPAYVLNMDVNVMPYRLNDRWTKAIHPLKLHEYLAAGRPIVAVELEALRAHADVVRFALGADDWERAIEEALEDGGMGTIEQRRAVARDNTWDIRADQLMTWFERVTT